MLALKDIEGIAPTLGNAPISKSHIWNQPVDKLVPAQLAAFRARMALEGNGADADAMLNLVLHRVGEAAKKGAIPAVAILDYYEPRNRAMLAGDLVKGFERMERPMPAAILFGLEAGLDAEEIVTLTWPKAKKMQRQGKLPIYAQNILASQPVHIVSQYVFWRYTRNQTMPLFGLEQEVFDVFGMVWGELASAYENLVLIDADAERGQWQQLILTASQQ